mmetsp:Transcript_12054/g.25670  ORF Transcript_12054/g.25670 Transcript_12054/m.25670 type:complete len:202 (-) Transcript_12054:464-1069(-)
MSILGSEKDGISGALMSTVAAGLGASGTLISGISGALISILGSEKDFISGIAGISTLGMSTFGSSGALMSLRESRSSAGGVSFAAAASSSLAAFWRSTANFCFSFSAARRASFAAALSAASFAAASLASASAFFLASASAFLAAFSSAAARFASAFAAFSSSAARFASSFAAASSSLEALELGESEPLSSSDPLAPEVACS